MDKTISIIGILFLLIEINSISVDAIRKKELIAFTEMTTELNDKLIEKENTFIYYIPYLEGNPVSTMSYSVIDFC